MTENTSPSVLCVDDDRDIADIVEAVLADEGYAVSALYSVEDDALPRAVGRLEPDCVLLDSRSSDAYGDSWAAAATLALRERPVPVVMFTAHSRDSAEAREGVSARARAANFVAILEKPFDLDDLIAAVAKATGRSVAFDRTDSAEVSRTEALVESLVEHGATEVRPSKMREWATFRDRRARLCQLYWWQGRGVYQLGRYTEGGRLAMVGNFVDRAAAIDAALPSETGTGAEQR